MLTDEQIREEAERRIRAMPPEEKTAIEDEIREGINLSHKAARLGYKYLTKEERRKFHMYNARVLSNQSGGGFEYAEIELEAKERLHCTREQIAGMPNPFWADVKRGLLITAIVGIGGVLLTAMIEKLSGLDMKLSYIGFSSASGYFALRCADRIVRAVRFKKLQKTYEKPTFQENEIQAAVFRILREGVKKGRGTGPASGTRA